MEHSDDDPNYYDEDHQSLLSELLEISKKSASSRFQPYSSKNTQNQKQNQQRS